MSPLQKPPSRAAKALARLPLALYALGLGRLLGHRFLVIVHRGRRSGNLYRTVVEVARWDRERREAIVVSGWGEHASWYRNLRAAPAVEIRIAGERFIPEQRFLDPPERNEVLHEYGQEHPLAARLLAPLLGVPAGDGPDGFAAAAERLPMVAFRLGIRAPSRDVRYLDAAQAARVYDRIGRLQDLQAFYEHRATGELLEHGRFGQASAVFELGFGTGALAERLLERLPEGARYVGVDVSPRMHELARRRLHGDGGGVELRLTDGSLSFPDDDGSFDRFVATYVLDLLAPDDIARVLQEAHRLLAPGGLLCVTSLAHGRRGVARSVTRAWQWLWERSPSLVGGCRPLDLAALVAEDGWEVCHRARVSSFGVSSGVLVAARR